MEVEKVGEVQEGHGGKVMGEGNKPKTENAALKDAMREMIQDHCGNCTYWRNEQCDKISIYGKHCEWMDYKRMVG